MNRTVAREAVDLAMTEKQWQEWIVSYAQLRKWAVYHPFDSRRSAPGWPDLAMVRNGRLIFAELKTEKGRVSPQQEHWLHELALVAGESQGAVEVHLWRPSDADRVMEVLR